MNQIFLLMQKIQVLFPVNWFCMYLTVRSKTPNNNLFAGEVTDLKEWKDKRGEEE